MNVVMLSGTVVGETRLSATHDGKSVMAKTLLRVDGPKKDNIIKLVAFGGNADRLNETATTGARILVEGHVVRRALRSGGFSHEIVLGRVEGADECVELDDLV